MMCGGFPTNFEKLFCDHFLWFFFMTNSHQLITHKIKVRNSINAFVVYK